MNKITAIEHKNLSSIICSNHNALHLTKQSKQIFISFAFNFQLARYNAQKCRAIQCIKDIRIHIRKCQ